MATISTDPRFKLARTLLNSTTTTTTGGDNSENNNNNDIEEAIQIFATLLSESIENNTGNNEHSLNTGLCYYEYGNALFRGVVRRGSAPLTEEGDGGDDMDKKPAAKSSNNANQALATTSNNNNSQREVMAAAALKRSAAAVATADDDDANSPSSKRAKTAIGEDKANEVNSNSEAKEGNDNLENGNENEDDDDDIELALEMLQNSFGILSNYEDNDDDTSDVHNNKKWLSNQIPRTLECIGDVHSFSREYPRAVDAYCRALPYRERNWEQFKQQTTYNDNAMTSNSSSRQHCILGLLEGIKAQRKFIETNVLIAEALLSCPRGQDVICQKDEDNTGDMITLVSAKERWNYIQSYYEAARLGVDDVLVRIGKLATSISSLKGESSEKDEKKKIEKLLNDEKYDMAVAVQLVVDVGTSLEKEEEES